MPNPQNLRPPWKKGESGNLRGPEKGVGAVRKLTQAQVKEVMDLVLMNDVGAIERIRKDPKTPLLQAWICSIALKGFKTGDHSAIEVLLARTIGKVKEVVDVNATVTTTITKQAISDAIRRDKFLDVADAEFQTLPHGNSQDEPLASEALTGPSDHTGEDDLRAGQPSSEGSNQARDDTRKTAGEDVASPMADPLRG